MAKATLALVGAGAAGLVVWSCIPDLTYDCSREAASCATGSVCIEGRCAEPVDSGECPSGLRYSDTAGAVAGECVSETPIDAGADPDTGGGPDASPPVAHFDDGQSAILVLGQAGFTTNTPNAAGPSGASLTAPTGVCVASNRLYVADSGNHRILVWTTLPTANGRAADFAIGQSDLTGTSPGTGAARLDDPQLIACSAGRLTAADRSNHRVLSWSSVPASAGQLPSIAFGQMDLNGADAAAGDRGLTTPGAADLFGPTGPVAIADTGNHRVLVWEDVPSTSGAAAQRLLGQDDFASVSPDRAGAAGAATLDTPWDVRFLGSHLWVVDRGNHRVLLFDPSTATGDPAAAVLGQSNFAGELANRGAAPAADTLRDPSSACAIPGGVAVVDSGNHRVLVYQPVPDATGATATTVLGQADFTTGDASAASASSLAGPTGCAFAGDMLFVTDTDNNRLLGYRATLE